MSKPELLTKKGTNPQYNKHIENRLLLLKGTNNPKKNRQELAEFLTFYGNILTSKARINVYLHFLKHGAATVREISKENRSSHTHYHRIIRDLADAGLIVPFSKIKSGQTMGGSPPTVWGLPEATPEDVREANSRYMRSISRIYVFVDQLYQRTLYEVKDEEIQYRKIVNICQVNGNRGFHFLDVAEEIAYRMRKQGITILNYSSP